jgi:N-carbamoylputrescine amidase
MQKEITVAAVQLWSSSAHTPDDNRAHALEMLGRAARSRPDLVVLPEAVSMLCYPDGRPGFSYRDVAEPVPGPTTRAAADVAAACGVNVVLGLIEDRGPERPCQNVVVVLDRAGRVAGRYEKTHEPAVCRREQAAGRGDALPVFDLDLGRIGVFVCWDLIAPEVAAILALQGAQLLCFPHLIGLPAAPNFAVSLRARAVDHGVPVVAAGMRDAHNHNGSQEGLFPTCVLDADGHVVAQSTRAAADVVSARLPLRSEPQEDWAARRRAELRPDLYARAYASLSNPQPEQMHA